MVDRWPAALSYIQVAAIIELTRQNAHSIVIFRLENLVYRELVVRHRAKALSATSNDFSADLPTGRHIPKHHATIQEIRGISLPPDIARSHVFHATSHRGIAHQFAKRGERLQAEHIIGIDYQRIIEVEVINQRHAPKIDLTQGV